FTKPDRFFSSDAAGQAQTQTRRAGAVIALVQTISEGICDMANNTDPIGFFAAEVLDQTAQRQPHKTAIITKDEELSFAALNQRVHALAGHLQQEGVARAT